MDTSAKGLNVKFPIYKADGTSFEDLVLHKSAFESVVMSLGDKITGDVYYKNNSLVITMQEYIVYEGVHYVLVNPPTIVREGLVKDNSEAKGLTKYSFTFYHPMYMLGNFEFTDVAVDESEERYLAQNKTFSWIGYLRDFVDKLNANLANTQWIVRSNVAVADDKLSEVLSFDNNFVSDALKTAYDTWKVPFVIDALQQGEYTYTDAHNNVIDYYDEGKRFVVVFGMPDERIMVDGEDGEKEEYVFKLGQGVGLKNNSRTPKNNKIVTRISGYGSENNIPWGYPQIVWTGDQDAKFIYGDQAGVYENVTIGGRTYAKLVSYPIYDGIVNGQSVKLIKHPFTRNHLMPSVYGQTIDKKVNPFNTDYDCDAKIIDYYDADGTFPNPCDPTAPSYEIHQFEDIKPELGNNTTLADNAVPYTTSTEGGYMTEDDYNDFLDATINTSTIAQEKDVLSVLKVEGQTPTEKEGEGVGGAYTYKYEVKYLDDYFLTVKYESSGVNFVKKVLYKESAPTPQWDDTMDDDGNYAQSYFKLTLPQLSFDLYACASITEEMKINMRSGACIGCTFPIMVDWEDYKKNFYDDKGNFVPYSGRRNYDKYPDSTRGSITVICQKEYETFGTIMPNVYQQPKQGDIIVFLGISLPQSYIDDAEEKLDEASIEYMLENNVPLYEYPLKFDEYFLKNNLNILQQIHNNTRIKFQFGGESPMALFVKQINIKWGDNILPQYDITLADDIEVVLNQIGQVTEDVSALRVQMSEMQKYYAQNLINDISSRLSRIQDDIALGKITFQQGLESIGSLILHSDIRSDNYIQGMTTQGRGWRIDELGNAEVESIRVRSFMEIMELLVNRLQAQEGDTMFSDNDQIDYVEKIEESGSTYYRLTFKEKWAGYFTSQVEGNILRGIANTLAATLAHVVSNVDTEDTEYDGRNSYFTSWMRVVAIPDGSDITLGNNQVLVVLYGDRDVPSGTNFEPCELMTVARWGNTLDPNEQGITENEKKRREALQSSFYVSTTEGRITKLTGVNSPKLQSFNYGTTLGIVPDFVKNWSIANRLIDGRDYLYAQGVIVGDFIKVDIEGKPLINYVDCGEWYDGGAQGAEPTVGHGIYLFAEKNNTNLQYETHEVWHNGALWRVKQHQPITQGGVDTYYEPTDNNSAYWQKLMASGDSTRQIYSYSSNAPVVPQAYDQDDEYTPSGWSSTPLALNQGHKDVYISTRKKHNGTWGQWSTPALFSHLAEDGTSIQIKGYADYLYGYDAQGNPRPQASVDHLGEINVLEYTEYEEGGDMIDIVEYDTDDHTYNWEAYGIPLGSCYIWRGNNHLYQATESGWVDLGQIKGDKGDDGKNTATVFIYKRSASQPTSTDKPTSALIYSFSNGSLTGNLNGWSAIIPQSDGNPCWVRQAFASSNQPTATILLSMWSTANKYTEDGKDGVSIEAQYSPDTIQIHTTWQTGDLYMRTRATNQTSWSDWQRIIGENGANGDYTDYSFGISALLKTASPTTAPSDISTWADAPIETTEQKPYLWSRVIKYVWVNGVKTAESTTYIRLTGEQGDAFTYDDFTPEQLEGLKGDKGNDGKDATEVNPNILLRTIFENKNVVKQAWVWNWNDNISIDNDTAIEGRKSIRLDGTFGLPSGDYIDFRQNVYGKVKTSTWYTLSFYSFSSQYFDTFLWNGDNSKPGCIDTSVGVYVDGVYRNIGNEGAVRWESAWTGIRHTITFKTASSFSTQEINMLFRCYSGGILTICMPKLEIGQVATAYMANESDLVGKMGKNYYYAGDWNASSPTYFTANDQETPYFQYNNNKWVYVGENGTFTCAQMGTPSSSNANFEIMVTDFKYLIAQAIFSAFAKLGSWTFNGDYMFSEKGIDQNGNVVSKGNLTYEGIGDTDNQFTPSAAFDAFTGQTSLSRDKVRFNPDGSGYLANQNISWDAQGNTQINGSIHASLMYSDVIIVDPWTDDETRQHAQEGDPDWDYASHRRTQYIIDPSQGEANFYILPMSTNPWFSLPIYLPPCSDYVGLELSFYVPSSIMSKMIYYWAYIKPTNGELIYYNDFDENRKSTDTYFPQIGDVIKLKCLADGWCVIAGNEMPKSSLSGTWRVGGASVFIRNGLIISIENGDFTPLVQ